MSADPTPIKIPALTMERVRLGARLHRCTQGEFVDEAVRFYVEQQRDKLAAGFDHAREVLGLAAGLPVKEGDDRP